MAGMLVAVALACLLAFHQDEQKLTYRIYAAGQDTGTERVHVRRLGSQLQIESRVELKMGLKYDSTLIADAQTLAGIRLSVKGELSGTTMEASMVASEGKLKVTRGSSERVMDLEKDAPIVEGTPMAHFIVLLRAPKPQVRAFLGSTMSHVTIRIESKPDAELRSKGGTLKAKHYFLRMEPVGMHAYVDAQGRVVRFTNPAAGIVLALDGFEDVQVLEPIAAPPAGVEEREVSFKSGALELFGSFTRPRDARGKLPLALLLPDAGALDRDGNPPNIRFDVLNGIAYELSQNGAAVLRFDKRGVGKSDGEPASKYAELIKDAEAALAWALNEPGIDPNRVCLIGHGEGGLIAAHVAVADTRVKSLFLLGAPAEPMEKILLKQVEQRLRAAGLKDEDLRRELETRRRELENLKRQNDDLVFDPLPVYKRISCALVIAHGGKDSQIPPDHARLIETALRDVGKKRFELTIFNDLDHLFMKSEDGAISRYYEGRPVDDGFLKYLADAFKK